MRLETDDSIHRFQGRWVSARGTAMPVIARYTAWGAAVSALLPLIIVGRVTRMPFGFFVCFVIGGCALLGRFVADYLTGEYTVSAWVGVASANVTAWRRARRARAGDHNRSYRTHREDRA